MISRHVAQSFPARAIPPVVRPTSASGVISRLPIPRWLHSTEKWSRKLTVAPCSDLFPKREFLLNIKFAMRETFAFGCEVYGRILELGGSVKERRSLLEKFARESSIAEEGEERTELLAILSAAVEARNGWKKILERCAEDSWKARRDTLLSKISQSELRRRDDR